MTTLGQTVLNQDFGIAEDASIAFDSFGRLSVVYALSNPYDSTNAIVVSESTDGINFSPPVRSPSIPHRSKLSIAGRSLRSRPAVDVT